MDRSFERSYESVEIATGRRVASVPGVWMGSAAALADNRVLFLRLEQPGGYATNELWEVQTDPASGAFRGQPREVAIPVKATENSDSLYGLSATADGTQAMVLRRSDQQTVFVADFEPSPPRFAHVRRLTFDERTNYPHAWTADSRAVIFESDRNGNYDLFKQRIDQRTPEVIVDTPLREVLPQLAPDGRSVLYAAGPAGAPGPYKLMRVPVEGGPPEEVPLGGPLDEFRCPLGSGRRCVVRTTVGHQYYAFHELDPVRGMGRELARTAWQSEVVWDWDISPDGSEVAIPNHDSGSARIRVVPLGDGAGGRGEREVVLHGLTDLSGLVSAPDGNGWFVSVNSEIGKRLLYVYPDGRFSSLGNIQGWGVPSPDGRRVAFLDSLGATNAWIIDRR
jgi:hypothetical protein